MSEVKITNKMVKIQKKDVEGSGVKLFIEEEGVEVARAFFYILKNDLHEKPFGLMEDVFVVEEKRKGGYGTLIVKAVIEEAKKRQCYKLVGTSRYEREKVHEFYKNLGFKDWGKEFRMNF